MAILLNDNIYVRAGKPVDYKFGPYLSINEANSNIRIEERYNGLIFAVYKDPDDIQNSDVKYYYYNNQLSDLDIKELNFIDDQSISLSKLQDIGSMTVIGRVQSGIGPPSEVEIITNLTGSTSTTLATSEAIKTYVDSLLSAIGNLQGGWDASTGSFPVSPASTKIGDYWYVTVEGIVDNIKFSIGDVVVAKINNASTSNSDDWILLEYNKDQATTTELGLVRLATDTDVQTGTDTEKAITPSTLSSRTATESRSGLAEIATQSETNTGSDDERIVTPLKLKILLDDSFQPLILSGTTAQYYRGDKTFQDFDTSVRNATLSGYTVGSDTVILNTDTVLESFEKIQGQINGRFSGTVDNGYIAFGNGGKTITGDNNLFWDNINKRLGIGTNTPENTLDIIGDLSVYSSLSGSTVLTISGTTGNLFSVSNNITGPIVKVKDIFEIDSSGYTYHNTVKLTDLSILNSPHTLFSINKNIGDGAYFEYIVINKTNNGKRIGTILAVWDNVNNTIEFTETSTNDINNPTSNLTFNVSIDTNSVIIKALIVNNTFDVKISVRII